MTDARIRELERASDANPADHETRAQLLRERVRSGGLDPEKLELAAYCGDVAACVALGGQVWNKWGRGCICHLLTHPRYRKVSRDPVVVHDFTCVGRPSKQEIKGATASFCLELWFLGMGSRYSDIGPVTRGRSTLHVWIYVKAAVAIGWALLGLAEADLPHWAQTDRVRRTYLDTATAWLENPTDETLRAHLAVGPDTAAAEENGPWSLVVRSPAQAITEARRWYPSVFSDHDARMVVTHTLIDWALR